MLTRIISGAVGVVILAAVLFFHDTIVLPIAVAAMIAIMLYELLRAIIVIYTDERSDNSHHRYWVI